MLDDWWLYLLAGIGALVLWLLLFAPNAHAFDNAGAVAIAVEQYGEPCGGAVAFQWGHLGSEVNARSTWQTLGSPETFSDCTITWSLDVEWTPAKFCTVTEHEVGHLTGHVHGESLIMAAYYAGPSPECVAAYPAAPRLAWRPGPKWHAAVLDRNPRVAVAWRHSRIHRNRRHA